jgi:group I intron endonuclease
MVAFVYKIENTANGKFYVGSTYRPKHIRKYEHLSSLRKNSHPNDYLQKSFNKYGENCFSFVIVETYKFPEDYTKEYVNEYLLGREFFFIENLQPQYNIKKSIERGKTGYYHSEETKRKISESHKKIKSPKEKKLTRPLSGWKHSPEAIEKIRARSSQPDNVERMRKMAKESVAKYIVGHVCTEESKIKMMQTKFKKHRPIEIYNKEGELLHTCNFSTEASKLTGVKRSSISNNLIGLSKSAGNLVFKYKND